jgi:hypothetical protein
MKLLVSEPIGCGKREDNASVLILNVRSNIIGQKSKIYLLDVRIPFIWQSDAVERVAMIHVDVPQRVLLSQFI